MAAAAAAAAKVLRGGRSGFSSRLLGSSTGHKGQLRNPVLSEGVNVKAPERMEQLCSKRSFHVEAKRERLDPPPLAIITLVTIWCGAVYTLPANYRATKAILKEFNN